MNVETKIEILEWYERQPRSLTPEFISAIPWDSVRKYPVDSSLIPVLLYMRDVETLTDMYYMEMRRTPTGRDPVIGKFMERWGVEEATHGEVLNRFLVETGIDIADDWKTAVRASVSNSYRFNTYLITTLTNLIGRKFTATHMTFGAIHEMTTAQAYRRMIDLARHPVLTLILTAIIREESAHTQFYLRMARRELAVNETAKRLARRMIDSFWCPVGQGSKPKRQTDYVISTLFGARGALAILDKTVTQRVQQLPGFAGLTRINEKLEKICSENIPIMGEWQTS
ncbi:MAG: ferritin-like domain-containing protein [Pyrinomonadaceae bacterium]